MQPNPRSELIQTGYRPDIDGVRAIAVLAVLGYHAFPRWVAGGFAGVDVFFVISGYLISLILLNDLNTGTFSFARFYGRRIRRIFPALVIVLAAIGMLGWFTLLEGEYRNLGKHIAGSAIFSSNFVLLDEVGYFDKRADLKPLLHLWSLAIEEQFYIIWPVIFYVAWKKKLNLLWVVLLLACLSFGLDVHTVASRPASAFYLPATRAWELSVGGLLAILLVFHPKRLKLSGWIVPSAISWAGLLCMTAVFFLPDETGPHPSRRALAAVIGTALLITAGKAAWLNRAVLSIRPLVVCGLISFPLYLWHWPLLSILQVLDRGIPPPMSRIAVLIFSGALAFLTYRLVERPLRFGRRLAFKTAVLATLMLAIGAAGLLIERDRIRARSSSYNMDKITVAAEDWGFPDTGFEAILFHGRTFYRSKYGTDHRTVWYFGDSHMEQFGPRISRLITTDPAKYQSAVFTTEGGCAPIRNVKSIQARPYCNSFFETAMEYGKRREVSDVVVGAAWHYYIGGKEYYFDDQGAAYDMHPQGAGNERAYQELEKMLSSFRRPGRHVYVVLEIPNGGAMDPEAAVVRNFDPRHWAFAFTIASRTMTTEDWGKATGSIPSRLREIGKSTGAEIIDPVEFLCRGGVCPALEDNGEPRYRDMDHLRATFVREHAEFIDRTLKKDE